MPSVRKNEAQRLHMAQIAARLMQEQGIRDFQTAKRKAAQQLGLDVRDSILPRNQEIEAALAEHQRLFDRDHHSERLRAMREAALDAMAMLEDFQPRLVGSVLSGLANAYSFIQLHVFADAPETFDLFLQSHGLAYEIIERRLRVARDQYAFYPVFQLTVGAFDYEITLFKGNDIRQSPLSPVDGAPMRRANRAKVERLLDDDALGARLGLG